MTIFASGRGAVCRLKQAATTPGARPAFGLAGTAYESTTAGATHQPTYPATVNAGEMAIAVMWGRQSGAGFLDFSLHANATAAGWTVIGTPKETTDETEELIVAYRTGLAGTEDGAAMEGGIVGTASSETESHVHGIIFTVSAANGFRATTPIEDIKSAEETGTTVNGPTVSPSSTNRLAVSVIGFSDDGIGAAAFTGASATWTERIDVGTALQTDSTIQVQTAPADSEVSGGSFTASLDVTRLRFSFAIAPADI